MDSLTRALLGRRISARWIHRIFHFVLIGRIISFAYLGYKKLELYFVENPLYACVCATRNIKEAIRESY